ncbi:nucleoporin NUP42-like [Bicyclus anynana]|uniref:Nucleoporin NUP42-like n=1 Tax=Bicyclus anynana TaxID=110368 RepID=A0A6J1P320_BICAN|nr:nucleoporin NUP42-like [Bicyclus anynana]XP_052747487.1 nucleoporin NUP42-like [Bicyclus anynana]
MLFIYTLLISLVSVAKSAPANGFVFPDERRQQRKLEPIITPPVLPVLEHLERDPSTLLPGERGAVNQVKPRFGLGGGFNVKPSGNGGLTASISSSANGAGASHSASQSFSFGFNQGFSASHSASQASSFNGFGNGFSGSQASSQAASFNGAGATGAASSASALGGFNGLSGSQSASSAFGFNSLNGFENDPVSFEGGLLDVRHRGVPGFSFPDLVRRHKALTAATFKSLPFDNNDDFLATLVSF